MNNCFCNKCKKTCDCGPQKPNNNPCGGGCGSCGPAKYGCAFDIQVSPYDPSTWIFDFCGCLYKIKAPTLNETCTTLHTNYSNSTLVLNGECGKSIITGDQLGNIINIDALRNVEIEDAESCDFLVFDPGCINCGDGCKPIEAKWRNYHIPDAGDCEIEVDDDGYYHVLIKDDCGCIRECRLPVVPDDSTIVDYTRDSVPDDPDYPWYYGCYNDTINLYLEQNVAKWFGKYPLEVTVNYGIQSIKSDLCPNTNFRSLIVPVVEGTSINVQMMSSILQGQSLGYDGTPALPWGSMSLRSSFTFIVPKGKDAYLHHEFRIRTNPSWPNYALNPTYDGIIVPSSEVTTVNTLRWPASRLNALQIIVRPVRSTPNFDPVKDAERSQLDYPTDEYPTV